MAADEVGAAHVTGFDAQKCLVAGANALATGADVADRLQVVLGPPGSLPFAACFGEKAPRKAIDVFEVQVQVVDQCDLRPDRIRAGKP